MYSQITTVPIIIRIGISTCWPGVLSRLCRLIATYWAAATYWATATSWAPTSDCGHRSHQEKEGRPWWGCDWREALRSLFFAFLQWACSSHSSSEKPSAAWCWRLVRVVPLLHQAWTRDTPADRSIGETCLWLQRPHITLGALKFPELSPWIHGHRFSMRGLPQESLLQVLHPLPA